ncbi:MAG: EamA family transporter [Actinobacteria bacterium]|nr:EamA family transporter [Actinomycetota bacterium]
MAHYILLAVFIQFLVAYGQYHLKVGARRLDLKKNLAYNIRNRNLVLAIILFLATTVLSIIVMRFMEFSIFYSFTALNYLFIMFFSWKILKERFDRLRILGNVLVILGVIIFNLK